MGRGAGRAGIEAGKQARPARTASGLLYTAFASLQLPQPSHPAYKPPAYTPPACQPPGPSQQGLPGLLPAPSLRPTPTYPPTHLHAPNRLHRAVVHRAAQRDGAVGGVHAVAEAEGQRRGGTRHLHPRSGCRRSPAAGPSQDGSQLQERGQAGGGGRAVAAGGRRLVVLPGGALHERGVSTEARDCRGSWLAQAAGPQAGRRA